MHEINPNNENIVFAAAKFSKRINAQLQHRRFPISRSFHFFEAIQTSFAEGARSGGLRAEATATEASTLDGREVSEATHRRRLRRTWRWPTCGGLI